MHEKQRLWLALLLRLTAPDGGWHCLPHTQPHTHSPVHPCPRRAPAGTSAPHHGSAGRMMPPARPPWTQTARASGAEPPARQQPARSHWDCHRRLRCCCCHRLRHRRRGRYWSWCWSHLLPSAALCRPVAAGPGGSGGRAATPAAGAAALWRPALGGRRTGGTAGRNVRPAESRTCTAISEQQIAAQEPRV